MMPFVSERITKLFYISKVLLSPRAKKFSVPTLKNSSFHASGTIWAELISISCSAFHTREITNTKVRQSFKVFRDRELTPTGIELPALQW
jgi:hypothetical protein